MNSLQSFDKYLASLIYCPVCDTPHEPDCIGDINCCRECGSDLADEPGDQATTRP